MRSQSNFSRKSNLQVVVISFRCESAGFRDKLYFERVFELQPIRENLGLTLGTCKTVKSVSLDCFRQNVHGLQPHKAFFYGINKKKALEFRNIDITEVV